MTLGAAADDSARGEPPHEVIAYLVSMNYFSLLGAGASIGRTFRPEDDRAAVAILSHQLWQRRFAGDAAVIGRPVKLNGHALTVVGVAASDFVGTEPLVPNVWVPVATQPAVAPGGDQLAARHDQWLLLIGRLKPAVGKGEAQRELSVIAGRLARAYPAAGRHPGVTVARAAFFPLDRDPLFVAGLIMAAVALVLAAACANVANLMLTRAASRRREIAIRLAVGSSRARLIRLLLAESLCVGVLAGALGLLTSVWLVSLLPPLVTPLLPFRWGTVIFDVRPDLHVFGYTAALSMLTAVAFGLVPALHSTRVNVSATLHGSAPAAGARRSILRDAFIVAQVAISLVLLVGGALLARASRRAEAVDVGFDPARVVMSDYDLGRHGYDVAAAAAFNRALLERAQALPGAKAAALASHVPLTGGLRSTKVSSAETATPGSVQSRYAFVTAGYFETLSIPIVQGRGFATSGADPSVAVISEIVARRLWPDQPALGKRIRTEVTPRELEIVGVARDTRASALWRDKEMAVYLPAVSVEDYARGKLLVKTADGGADLIPELRSWLHARDAGLSFEVTPLEQVVRLWTLPSRIAAATSAALALLALLLAWVGTYGLMAYAVNQRTREIGIRVAIGARPDHLLRLLLKDGARVLIAGVGVGTVLALGGARVLAAFLFGLSPADLPSYAGAVLVVVVAVGLASYLPARRAARVDPIVALRVD